MSKRRSVSPGPAITKVSAFNDSYAVGRGRALMIPVVRGVLVNDRDPQNKSLIAILVTNPLHGTLTFKPDGSFTYTNDGTGFTSDSFTYLASNGTDRSSSATVSITIGDGDKITVVPESYSLEHGDSISVSAPGVLANDIDPNGAPLIAQTVVPPAHGTLALSANGAFVYTHDGSNTLSDSFAYKATNGTLTSAPSIVTLTISADLPPRVASQSYATLQNTALTVSAPGVLTGATDPDSATITAVLQSQPSHGTLTLQTNGSFVYTPAAGYVGGDSFTYLGSDGIKTSLSEGKASITVTPPAAPVAADDRYVATTSTLTVSAPGVLGNDTPNGASLLSYGASGNDQSAIGLPAVTTQKGQITLSADGSFVYQAPGTTFAGTDTFKYILRNTVSTSTATVTITVSQIDTKCSTITITPSTLPSGTVGSVYPGVSFSQSGGSTPISWSSGTLPAGMSFSNAGVLSGTPTVRGTFNIAVTATDSKGCYAVKTLTLTVGCPSIAIANTSLSTATSGVAYTAVTLSQSGGVAPVAWSLTSGSGPLPAGMTLSSAGVLSGTPTQTGTFPFIVQVTDANGCTATRTFSLSVVSKCSTITISPTSLAAGAAGSVYPAVSFSATGGTAPFTWSSGALPPGMAFSTAGVLSGTPTARGVYNIVVTATDANGCSATTAVPLAISIDCPTIAIADVNLGTATSGVAFTDVTLSSTGGVSPIAWSLATGSLPAGMTLSSAGKISGTPTQVGTFPFTVQATDANGCFGTKSLSLTVNSKCPTIVISPTSVAGGSLGVPYSAVSFSQTGGTAPVTWAAGSMPAGMTLSTGGVLSGTPTAAGDFNITVTATDANACTASIVVPFAVSSACPTIAISTPTLAVGTAGSAYPSVTLQATGGVSPIAWTVALGTLPTGMTLSSAGVLSGTPALAGTYDFTVKATDANGCSDTEDLQLIVSAVCATPITISGTPPDGTAGSSYVSYTFTQSNGTTPVTWSSGALPAGMTLSTGGVLSGTPTVTGTFTLALVVTDANSCAATASIPFTVNCPSISVSASSTISPSTLPSGTAGTKYTDITFSQVGGIGTAVWSVASGTLPAGLDLSSAGKLSGTPTVAGTYTVSVRATDANGCTGTASFTLTIACQTITVTKPATTTGSVNSAFSATFTQSGGSGTTTFSTTSTLPAGLSLSSVGVLSGTPTQTGSFPINVTATDSGGCTGASSGYILVVSCGTIAVSNPSITGGTTGTAFSQTFTASGNVGATTFALASGSLPAGLTLSSAGVLSGTPTQIGSFAITVRATDSNGCTGTGSTYALVISCGTITVSNPAVTSGAVNTAFSQQFTATGTNGATTFAVVSGSLPSGLTLSSSGLLSGTPTANGSFPITVRATDANGCQGTGATYTLVIGCPTITVTHATGSLSGSTSNSFLATFSASGGVAPRTFSALTTLVQGLAGPTDVAVDSSGNIYVSDTNSTSVNAIKKWNAVTGAVTTLATGLIEPGGIAVDGSGNVYFSDTGNSAVRKYTASTGLVSTIVTDVHLNHPQGLAVDSAGNVYIADTSNNAVKKWTLSTNTVSTIVSGLAAPTGVTIDGSGNLYIADSGNGAIKKWTSSGNIVSTAVSGLSTPTDVVVDSSNNLFIAETGTGSIRKWSSSSGISTLVTTLSSPLGVALDSLGRVYIADTGSDTVKLFGTPPGLTLSTAGNLSGTPTLKADFPVRIFATDANGCTGNAAFTVSIGCGSVSVINPGGSANGITNQPYSKVFTASGTNGAVVFTTTSTLPGGLSLSAGGVLAGMPTQTGTFVINVRATDANGCTALGANYTIVITCGTVSVSNPAGLTGATGGSYSRTFTASGTNGAVTFSTTSVLPQGLSLATNGVLSGTPTQTGTFIINVVATDANGCAGVGSNYTITIGCGAISISANTALQNAHVRIGDTVNGLGLAFQATGTNYGQTFLIFGLPTGLTGNADGTITGTIPFDIFATGDYLIQVIVVDGNGCTGGPYFFTLTVYLF